MAYADEKLDAVASAEVEAYLATDEGARNLVKALRESAALAREAFDEPLREPVPQALIDTVMGTGAKVTSIEAARARRRGTVAAWALPLAASLAIAAGAAYLVARTGSDDNVTLALGSVPESAMLHRLLEAIPSGMGVDLDRMEGASGRKAIVLSTFRDRMGRACREIEVTRLEDATAPLGLAVACRNPDARWEVVGAAEVLVTRLAPDGTFVPSGDRHDDPLAEVFTMLGAGPQIEADEEAALIGRDWQ